MIDTNFRNKSRGGHTEKEKEDAGGADFLLEGVFETVECV